MLTDRILLLLRVLGVLALGGSCWVGNLLLPENREQVILLLESENGTYFFMPGINPDTWPITPPAIL